MIMWLEILFCLLLICFTVQGTGEKIMNKTTQFSSEGNTF